MNGQTNYFQINNKIINIFIIINLLQHRAIDSLKQITL